MSREKGRYQSWWDLWPGLYADELKAFDEKGATHKVILKQSGFLILEVVWPIEEGGPLCLRVGYSPFHPFIRPAVAAIDREFGRHQNPFSKELCLLTQETRQWNSSQLVADFIEERLPQVFDAVKARDDGRWADAAKLEENAADPLTSYFVHLFEKNSVILFDGQMSLPNVSNGLMGVEVWSRPHGDGVAFSAILHRLTTLAGRLIGGTFNLPKSPTGGQVVPARWVKMQRPPIADSAEELLEAAEREFERQNILQPRSLDQIRSLTSEPFLITGISFPEEVEYGTIGVGWLFVVSRRGIGGGDPSTNSRISVVRAERASKADIFARLPVANNLQKKKVLLLGCGAIGGFVATELARAGVGHLQLVDYDAVQPGNSLRWPLGREYWGVKKTLALANFIGRNYPFTDVRYIDDWRIGVAPTDPSSVASDGQEFPNHLAYLRNLIEEADVVVDTTASSEVQAAVSYLCKDVGKPHVVGYATQGLVGGLVARFTETSQACWVCINKYWNNGIIPEPRQDVAGIVTPVGCNSPTFSGGGYDIQEVSMEVVRTAVGLLSDGLYDAGSWCLAVLDMRDDDGCRTPPRWKTYNPGRHPQCGCAEK